MAEKIYKIQKELEEKRRTRLQKQGVMPNQSGLLSAGGAQPPSMTQLQSGLPPNGPLSDPTLMRPNVPSQIMNRMQTPSGMNQFPPLSSMQILRWDNP